MTTYHLVQSRLKTSTSQFDALNTTKMKVAMLFTAAALIVLYVYQTSSLATRTFAIHDLQQELRVLEMEHRELEVQIAEERSLSRIESRLAEANFVAADDIAYIGEFDTAVARR